MGVTVAALSLYNCDPATHFLFIKKFICQSRVSMIFFSFCFTPPDNVGNTFGPKRRRSVQRWLSQKGTRSKRSRKKSCHSENKERKRNTFLFKLFGKLLASSRRQICPAFKYATAPSGPELKALPFKTAVGRTEGAPVVG